MGDGNAKQRLEDMITSFKMIASILRFAGTDTFATSDNQHLYSVLEDGLAFTTQVLSEQKGTELQLIDLLPKL